MSSYNKSWTVLSWIQGEVVSENLCKLLWKIDSNKCFKNIIICPKNKFHRFLPSKIENLNPPLSFDGVINCFDYTNPFKYFSWNFNRVKYFMFMFENSKNLITKWKWIILMHSIWFFFRIISSLNMITDLIKQAEWHSPNVFLKKIFF